MNFGQIRLLNQLKGFMEETEAWKSRIEGEIAEISAKMGEISSGGSKRGPVPGLKVLKERVEALETILNDLR